MTWKPQPKVGVNPLALPLDARQGFLFSRLDGASDLPTLAALTGMAEPDVAGMLADLVALGAVEAEAAPAMSPAPQNAPPSEPVAVVEVEEAAEDPEVQAKAATHRALYAQTLAGEPEDLRVAKARAADEPELSAYCFDPLPPVIAALLENPRFGPVHARLVAAHHRATAGLELLAARTAFAMDDGVRRALLKNPVLSAGLYRRLWSNQRLLPQFLVTTNRDATEQVRAMARDLLRASFNQRTGDERVELILTTEGRCLAALAGLTIDGQTTALLCRRSYVSTLLIQNLARWAACPPQLVAHLRRQEVVRRNPTLRMMLERHPNAS